MEAGPCGSDVLKADRGRVAPCIDCGRGGLCTAPPIGGGHKASTNHGIGCTVEHEMTVGAQGHCESTVQVVLLAGLLSGVVAILGIHFLVFATTPETAVRRTGV